MVEDENLKQRVAERRADRQAIADSYLSDKRQMRKLKVKAVAGYYLRKLAYSNAFFRAILTSRGSRQGVLAVGEAGRFFDKFMAAGAGTTYLGGTIQIDCRNSVTAELIRWHANPSPDILDIGCAAGTIVPVLPPYNKYLGIDASSVAIEEARNHAAIFGNKNVLFETADMRSYPLQSHPAWDVIIFNEVLYYLSEEDALHQVRRYSKNLRANGIICVSLKDSPKSHFICKQLKKIFEWKDGLLMQRKPLKFDFRTRISGETPAFLIGVMVPR